jgi:hypothetical protein
MKISGEKAHHFEIGNFNFAFCPAEAGKFIQLSKGLNGYPISYS